jgi:hypothetical protein
MIQHPYIIALLVILGVGIVSWLVSVIKKDVSFVDSLWSLFFLIAAVVFALEAQPLSVKGKLVLALVVIWSLSPHATGESPKTIATSRSGPTMSPASHSKVRISFSVCRACWPG